MNKCQECGRNDNFNYCKPCNSVHFRNNFIHWTSGDSNLDKLIQNSQLNATIRLDIIEWIEYSNLENIELIAHGGFGSVYKAIWKDGPIVSSQAWDLNKSEWKRENKKEVAVKKFQNVTIVSSDFLNEVNSNLKMNNKNGGFETIRIYGVTRDPQSGEYAIVIQFKNGGNLRKMIKENYSNLTWENILEILNRISEGLDSVHESKCYHKDLHSGNILNKIYSDNTIGGSVISDFGLCRPMDQSSTDKTLYGVLPFVAPEVLLGKEFTEAADIYGFGMIMSELISGEPPFVDREYDENLALAICYGQRPQIPEYTPEPYAELMKRCWDHIPTNRPTANELCIQFMNLFSVLDNNNNLIEDRKLEIKEAFSQEREDKFRARLAELATNPIPLKKSQNLLTSKRLDYSQSLSQKLSVEDWNKLKLTD
ncbi:kinase-like protein [Rhizophagus irregularis]|uniref:Kinase-like protein n=1 Tax=Rhizophagus irregularis TaxID=588596 RepID=A0A2N0P1U7_9GLOM|nr:kinase-like protein [Rhizophagus irregularis]